MRWQGIIKGTGLFVAGLIVVSAVAASSKHEVSSISTNSHPAVLGTKVSPSKTIAPTASPTPTNTPVVTPPPATPKPAPVLTSVVKPATPVPTTQTSCDPNYSGCVPIASDVDCAGGSGNGPAYVRGPIKVTGTDIYRLDADHDGIACE